MSRKIHINIDGMHCRSCKTLIEEEVGSLSGVAKISVDHVAGTAELQLKKEGVEEDVFKKIKDLGYKPDKNIQSRNKPQKKKKKFLFEIVLLAFFVLAYFLVQALGGFEVLAKLNEDNVGYTLIFIIGVLASFHCIGMCGGLVVSYTIADQNKIKDEIKPNNKHFLYNLGRLISYTIIGAILGGFGSFFGINPGFSGTLLLVAGVLMFFMGLSILTHFRWIQAIKNKLPFLRSLNRAWGLYDKIAKYLYRNKKTKNPKGPLAIGLLTGFMPCGPLQAMQLYALTSGSITEGALSMFLYALGTVPLMFGFGNVVGRLSNSKISKVIKVSGAVVIVLGLIMFNRGLVNFGYGFTGFASNDIKPQTQTLSTDPDEEIQIVKMDVTYRGYDPNVIYIKKDVPVRWIIRDKGITGCTNEIFLYHEDGVIKKRLTAKENIIEFTPTQLGELRFSCWMRMVWGKFIVTDDVSDNSGNNFSRPPEASASSPSQPDSCNGSCGGTCAGAKTGSCGCGANY